MQTRTAPESPSLQRHRKDHQTYLADGGLGFSSAMAG